MSMRFWRETPLPRTMWKAPSSEPRWVRKFTPRRTLPLGHYKHLDAINRIRAAGSIEKAIETGLVQNGIMHAITLNRIPYVLAGSIRDDGPLPEVTGNVYEAQNQMRELSQKATTVIAMATQLHTIAAGNMTPSYQVMADQRVRPVYFYSVDMSEFAASKLADRGSLTARSILTNVQDFVVTVERGLRDKILLSPSYPLGFFGPGYLTIHLPSFALFGFCSHTCCAKLY